MTASFDAKAQKVVLSGTGSFYVTDVPSGATVQLSARLGVDCGRSIPPVNRLTDEQRREVPRVAEALGMTGEHSGEGRSAGG